MKFKKIFINQDILKLFALACMTIDHGIKIFNLSSMYWISSSLGRMAFPIFSFLMMAHLEKKQIFKKYSERLASFGVLTFLVLIPFGKENDFKIFFSFFGAVLFLKIFQKALLDFKNKGMGILFLLPMTLIFLSLSLFMEYGMSGFIYLILWYLYFLLKDKPSLQMPVGIALILGASILNLSLLSSFFGVITTLGLCSLEIKENDKRLISKWWTFYLYYPIHLVFLLGIAYLINR